MLLCLNPEGNAVHSCVYIADNIVFTKNGENALSPWLHQRQKDIEETTSAGRTGLSKATEKCHRKPSWKPRISRILTEIFQELAVTHCPRRSGTAVQRRGIHDSLSGTRASLLSTLSASPKCSSIGCIAVVIFSAGCVFTHFHLDANRQIHAFCYNQFGD